MARFHSYRPVLETLCRRLRPRQILEWGPGESTVLMSDLLPDAKILSIEHDVIWYASVSKRLRNRPGVEVAHVPHLLPYGGSAGYVTYPLRRLLRTGSDLAVYDLIFVDGRSRCDCLTVAALLVAARGVVLLHDAERPNYRRGLSVFPVVVSIPQYSVVIAAQSATAIPVVPGR